MAFKTNQAIFEEEEIKLTRNGFAYESIPYSQIQSLKISKGFLIKRREILLPISVLFVLTGVYFLLYFSGGLKGFIGIGGPVSLGAKGGFLLTTFGPLMAIILGFGSLISCLIRSKLAVVNIANQPKPISIRLKKIERQKQIEQLVEFLKEKVRIDNSSLSGTAHNNA